MPSLQASECQVIHPINQAFLSFLAGPATQADHLMIMGDLFEAWLGDDVSMPFYQREIEALVALKQSNTSLYIGVGNRDFLMGSSLMQACQATPLYEDVIQLNIKQKSKILLMHGDSLCTDDKAYQRLRFFTQQAWFKNLLRNLPKTWRLKLANHLRKKSSRTNQHKSAEIMDVTAAALDKIWQTHPKAEHLIHGHTHRPGHHQDQRSKQRWVVSDWQPSGANYVMIENGQPRLARFQLPLMG